MMRGRWVKVKDESPPVGRHVLILDKYGVMIVGKREPTTTGDKYSYQWDEYSDDEFVFPEYWVELPSSPDKTEKK